MTTTTGTLTFEWSLSSADGVPPERLRTLAPRTEVNLPPPEGPDMNALELLRGAGLHFDQEAVTPHPDQRQLMLTGEAPADDIALAIVDAVRERNATLAVDASSSPLRLFEVGGLSSPMLVIASLNSGASQVPAEYDAVGDALRRASAEREHLPPAAPIAPNGAASTNGTASSNGAASMNGMSGANGESRHRLSPDDVAPDVSHQGGERADEMVMQEPEQQHYILNEHDKSKRERALGMVAAPISGAAGYAGRARIVSAVVPLSIAGAAIAGRKFGSPRRWFGIAAVVSGAAAAVQAVLMRRRRQQQVEASMDAQAHLDSERVEMERQGTTPPA